MTDFHAETGDQYTEMRSADVTDPDLSPGAERELADDVREMLGSDPARVSMSRPGTSRRKRPRSSILLVIWSTNGFFLKDIIATLIVVAAVVGIAATHSWWMLGLAFVVLAACMLWIVRLVFGLIAIPERPHPATIAALEEDGIRDPEEYFSRLVSGAGPSHEGSRDERRSLGPGPPGLPA